MTLEEASRNYGIALDRLKYYEANGLLHGPKTADGIPDYPEEELLKVGQIRFLLDAGMAEDELRRFLELSDSSAGQSMPKEEQMKILRKCRFGLLDEIHKKQQALDRLDYFLHGLQDER